MPHVAARTASRDRDTGRYQSHRPEQTLLYQIVDEYYPAFAALMAEQGKELPGYVQREFEEFRVSRDSCGTLLPEGSVPGSLGGWNNFSHKHWV